MPKKAKEKKRRSCREDDEFVKAAAWAWYQHGAGAPSKLISEFDAQNRQKSSSTAPRPSRFKLEATRLNNLRPKSLGARCQMTFEQHEEEDVINDSSLLDYYEIVEVSRHLEKRLSFSVKKSEKSSIERGLSSEIRGDVGGKKKVSNASKSAVVKHWWTPVMCNVTDVVVPGMDEIGRRSPKKKVEVSERFHGVKQRLRQALVPSSSLKSPSHDNHNMRASSVRKNSLDSSHRRQYM